MSNLRDTIIFGIIHGLTQFFPISSSGHMFLAKQLLDLSDPSIFYVLLLYISTLLSVVFVLRKSVFHLIRAVLRIPTFCKNLFLKGHLAIADDDEVWTCILVLIATIVTGILAGLLRNQINNLVPSYWLIASGFLVSGTMLYSTKNLVLDTSKAKQKKEGKYISQVTLKDSILVGIAQLLAFVPGFSRPASTISASLWLRINRKFAGEFSFLISLPVIVALLIQQFVHGVPVEHEMIFSYLIGFGISLALGIFSLMYLLRWIQKGKLHYFAYYCWAMGIITGLMAFRH